MYNVFIVNATPGSQYALTQVGAATRSVVSIEIGATGAYYVSNSSYPITKITKIKGADDDATVNYGYYDVSVPDNFGYISKITSKDEIAQIVGVDEKEEILSTYLEDIRRDVGDVYTLIIKSRPIETIYKVDGKYSKSSTYLEPI
jgi:hypothetical protein